MKTRDELINDLKNSKKNYSEDQINEIVANYEKTIKNRKNFLSRSEIYSEISGLLGVDSLNDVRFYKIMNATAVVVRDKNKNTTRVAFSFYNINDLINDCKSKDKVKDGDGISLFEMNNIPAVHQITVSKDRASCLQTSKNYKEYKFSIELPGLRVSELAVYEAWVTLCKDKIIPRRYRNFNLDFQIIAVNEIRKREERRRNCCD